MINLLSGKTAELVVVKVLWDNAGGEKIWILDHKHVTIGSPEIIEGQFEKNQLEIDLP